MKYGHYFFIIAGMLLSLVLPVSSTVITVAKSETADFKTIQAAVNAATNRGDTVLILDDSTYNEQVTIDSTKDNLTLCSKNPLALKKPIIRYRDVINNLPKDSNDAKNDSTINFDKNGALRLLKVRNATIDGIAVDGISPYVFAYPDVWINPETGYKSPLQHGNSAITVWVSGEITIKNCNTFNAYIGINVKDRNYGGVYANPNPSDIDKYKIVPLSGFGKTGNHLFENNRIHKGFWGFYFESAWDLGSVVRYNLIYDNFITNPSVIPYTDEKRHLPGGAVYLKDNNLSPIAFYNNTFWNNSYLFVNTYRPGAQHLLFNNIFANPHAAPSGDFRTDLDIIKHFDNRIHNCIFTNSMPVNTGDFAATAKVVKTDLVFKSTNETSADFLVPDWTNANALNTIVNQGWTDAGLRDLDDSNADIGAYSQASVNNSDILIVPTKVVAIDELTSTNATLSFKLNGDIKEPKISYIRWLRNIKFAKDDWGPEKTDIIQTANIIPIDIADIPPLNAVENNEFTVKIPKDTAEFGFFELFIEGKDSEGKKVSTVTGFLPYRRIDYKFMIEIWNMDLTRKLDTVRAGNPYKIKIYGVKRATGDLVKSKFSPVGVYLNSKYLLLDSIGVDTFNIDQIDTTIIKPAIFTKVPLPSKIDNVLADGSFTFDNKRRYIISGKSNNLTILPGVADSILFVTPLTNTYPDIEPDEIVNPQLKLFDKFGNVADIPTKVTLRSVRKNFGEITDSVLLSDNNGLVTFKLKAIGGNIFDTIPLAGILSTNNKQDIAGYKLSKSRDKLWILYSDTSAYNSSVGITGCSGDRFPVTVRTSQNSSTISTIWNTFLSITLTNGLKAFASENLSDNILLTQLKLTNGQARFWITCTSDKVTNGSITLTPVDENNIASVSRSNINFDQCYSRIQHASFYADNGFGRVDELNIYFDHNFTTQQTPDSIVIYWPEVNSSNKKIIPKSLLRIDPSNSSHLKATLPSPYPQEITKGSNANLGFSYWSNPNTPDAPEVTQSFVIKDSVGPLLTRAILVERLDESAEDTMLVSFTEEIAASKLIGRTLRLLINNTGTTSDLIINDAQLIGNNFIQIVVRNDGGISPQNQDSLKIIADGAITDNFGNHSHPLNRPVIIVKQPIFQSIASAGYYDSNADGKIDRTTITFNKDVELNNLHFVIKFHDFQSEKLNSDVFTYGDNKRIVNVNLNSILPNSLNNTTSGEMTVTMTDDLYPDRTETKNVSDKAAPVLVQAIFAPSITDLSKDTLVVTFSENFKSSDSQEPFRFSHGNMEYSVNINKSISSDKEAVYIVNSISGVRFPESNDSVWISTPPRIGVSAISDISDNLQENDNNKRVLLKVKYIPYKLMIKAGPNPFQANKEKITLRIYVTTRTREYVSFKGSIDIFDQWGAKVKRFSGEVKSSTELIFHWDGLNDAGRKIGGGTYYAIINASDLNNDNRAQPIKTKILIGCKRD
jgi:hypothetical protein